MKLATTVPAVLVGLLGMAAGGAKVALTPTEVAFLGQFGFNQYVIMAFGGLQLLGGLALLMPASRLIGAVLTLMGFAISTALLTFAGDHLFALVSILPLLLTGWVLHQTRPRRKSTGDR